MGSVVSSRLRRAAGSGKLYSDILLRYAAFGAASLQLAWMKKNQNH